MESKRNYNLQLSSLKNGLREYEFVLSPDFFALYPDSPIENATIKSKVYLDKRENMISLSFHIAGTIEVECDYCLENFFFPIDTSHSVLIKTNPHEADGVDVLYIAETETQFNIADLLYEFVIVSIPISRRHEMASQLCTEDLTQYLNNEDKDNSTDSGNKPFLDSFKDFTEK